MAATGGFSLIEVPMGNGQHEQKVDKLQILNPNVMYMITGLFLTKFASVIQYVYHHRAKNKIGPYGETNMFFFRYICIKQLNLSKGKLDGIFPELSSIESIHFCANE